MGASIPDIISIGKSIKDFIDYWTNFKGKKIRIIGKITSEIRFQPTSTGDIEYHAFKEIAEGVIDSVQSYPPGIILKDGQEFIRHEYQKPNYIIGAKGPTTWIGGAFDSINKRPFKRKLFTFNFINAIEFIEE